MLYELKPKVCERQFMLPNTCLKVKRKEFFYFLKANNFHAEIPSNAFTLTTKPNVNPYKPGVVSYDLLNSTETTKSNPYYTELMRLSETFKDNMVILLHDHALSYVVKIDKHTL